MSDRAMPLDLPRRITAIGSARFACAFVVSEFVPVIRILAVPGLAVALFLYVSLRGYLSGLTQFISTDDARAASLALGALAAGIFGCLFVAAVVVSALLDLALTGHGRGSWIQFRARRQVWRLYAAYLRVLLVMSGFVAATYLLSVFLLPRLTSSPAVIGLISATVIIAGCYGLSARLGFMIAPIVAQTTGSVLRKAVQAGSGDVARNVATILLLSFPGVVIELAGEYLFRLGSRPARIEITLPLVAYARALGNRLGEFVFLSTIAILVTIVLITAASIACYRDRAFDEAAAAAGATVPTLDSARV